MQLTLIYGAALLVLALLALALPALGFSQHRTLLRNRGLRRFNWLNVARFMASELGYTTTYVWPGGASGPSTTAPTQATAAKYNSQLAQVAMGDAETFAYFTHNWGAKLAALGAPYSSYTNFLFPWADYHQSDIGVGPSTQLATLTFNISNSNVLIINKLAAVGNGGTFIVRLMLPQSNGL